jgi:hypothetical protein
MTKNFEFSKLDYVRPKKQNNMYIADVLYDNQQIHLKLNRKITASGVYRGGNKFYMDLVFDCENTKDVEFINLYKRLEMSSMKKIYEKYNEWMGLDKSLEWENIYTAFKSHLSEENGIYKIKLNLITKSSMMETIFYNEDLEKISYKNVEEGDELSLILEFRGIKFGKETFENQWEVLQVKLYNKEDTQDYKNIIENFKKCEINIDSDTDEDEEDMDSSIDIEEMEKLEKEIENKYQQYIQEESLKIIE